MKPLQTNTSASARMALKERYTVDDILLELEMVRSLEVKVRMILKGIWKRKWRKTAAVRRLHLRKRAAWR